MLPVVIIFCSFLLSSTLSQIIPLRFEQAIGRLHQYGRVSPNDFMRIVQYDLTLEKMIEHMPISSSNNLSSVCDQQFTDIMEAVLKKEMWAIKVVDAWGKPLPSGVLKGNFYWLGDYDECIQPMYNPVNKSFMIQPFDTQHCVVKPKAVLDVNAVPGITLGVCVPSSCDRENVISLIHKLFKKTNLTIDNLVCSTDPPNRQKGLTKGAIATITILSILGFLVLLGTIVDLLLMSRLDETHSMIANNNDETSQSISENRPPHSRYSPKALVDVTPNTLFFAEFSALKSLRRIFTLKQKYDSESYLFLNGIRVLSLFWVIIGHTFVFSLTYTSNVLDVLSWMRNFAFQLLLNAFLSVDTFFVLSGFLTAILFVREVRKKKKLSIRLMILYYIHRYIRLTPTFLIIVLVSINLTPYFGHGPGYPTQDGFEVPQCRSTYWWTSILYVGNIVRPDYMCLPVSWYLCNDMQFHWIAPLTLIPFALGRKSFAYVVAILFVLLGSGSILTVLLYYPEIQLNFLGEFATTNGSSFFQTIYVAPWCRISPYAFGVLTGYSVINVGRQYRMNRYVKFLITLLIALIGLACLFGTYPDSISPSGLDRSILVTYQSLSRTFWAICIGWILFLCSTNQGGIINKILSWPIWSPFTKLNYSCYLIHSTVLYVSIFNHATPIHFEGHVVMNTIVSYIFFSYTAAILVYTFIETPFFIIEKKLFKR